MRLSLPRYLDGFFKRTDGAVTVDWVVLTAAIVSLAFAITMIVSRSATDPAEGVGARLSEQGVSLE